MPLQVRNDIRFGTIHLNSSIRRLYKRLNETIIGLVRSLPRSVQSDAMFFMMEYGRIALGEPLDFFKNYYQPIWTILYHLLERGCGISPDTSEAAITAHALALHLHSLDDHLNDGEVPCNHLTLLIRGQAWHLMTASLEKITDKNRYKSEISQKFIDDYYRGITDTTKIEDIDAYCETFRLQMATVAAVPALVMDGTGMGVEEREEVLLAFTSFGIAWRLLDDIHDLEEDLTRGVTTGVYLALPEEGQSLWKKFTEQGDTTLKKEIFSIITETGALKSLTDRIVNEMDRAAVLADKQGLTGYARELRELVKPITKHKNEQSD